MKLKSRLINICIRHKCSSTQDSNNTWKQFSKKCIRSKKNEIAQFGVSVPTSQDEARKQNECQNEEIDDKEKPSTRTLFCTSSFSLIQKGTPDISNTINNCQFEDMYSSHPSLHYFRNKIPPMSDTLSYSNQKYNINKTIRISENESKDTKDHKTSSKNNETRVNEINMQMLSRSLHQQLFKNASEEHQQHSMQDIKHIKNDLKQYGINIDTASRLPDVNIQIPPLKGDDIEQHFFNIAQTQTDPYLKIINTIINDIPEPPKEWLLQEGWTRYTKDSVEPVDYPLENGIIFDVEVCVKEGPLPTIATAVTKDAWYGWVSKSLLDCTHRVYEGQSYTMDMLIPMESKSTEHGEKLNAYQKKPKIIVGHNVSYDRIRIKEQYWLNCTGTRFIDTMSLHICVSGINSYQRAILTSKAENEEEDWQTHTSLNNLSEVHKLYCGSNIDKEMRNIFVEGSLEDVKVNFNELMNYCASDVVATQNVLRNIFPTFQERFPHPVTLAGMLELSTAYLPVNSNWQRYLEEADFTFEDLNYETKFTLAKRADAVCSLLHNEKYKRDLWMWDEDWSTQTIKTKCLSEKKKAMIYKVKKEKQDKEQSDFQKYLTDDEDEEDPLEKKFAYIKQTRLLLPAKLPHMPGYPAWYRKLCPRENSEDWIPGPQNISPSMKIVPKLLNLTWENYPLHYMKEKGWGILVPYMDDLNMDTRIPLKELLAQCPLKVQGKLRDTAVDAMISLNKEVEADLHKTEFWRNKSQPAKETDDIYKGSALWCNTDVDNCCYFFKLPHKDGAKCNVGSPLAKDFLNKFSDNVLAGLDASATHILTFARMLSYWRNNRDRVHSQFVIWFEKDFLPSNFKRDKKEMQFGAILPQVIVCGTLTRRAVEPTWMTASNAHPERIGSELRAMIQAPPGYNIVGADVDSQELWIASIIGDAHYKKIHGATPFGWMTLIGNKADGTDMHSVTAKAVGISRDHAKIINYARIYGAGQPFAKRLLAQFNPTMTEAVAASKAKKMFALTKGRKVYRLKPEFTYGDMQDKDYLPYEAMKLAKLHGKTLPDLFQKGEWIGGSESAMFNRLEEIAESLHPVTPFLNARLTRALESDKDTEKYLPTKVNWVVQSGAVDFLHLMLVSMRWLMKDNARFCLSFHDEVRYLVPSKYKYNSALAMHVTNLLTRAFCASRLGMKDLPMSVAFFTSVEVDTVLRKESTQDCKTPSNPHGLQNGYDIPPGESLNVMSAIEKSGGSLGSWHNTKN